MFAIFNMSFKDLNEQTNKQTIYLYMNKNCKHAQSRSRSYVLGMQLFQSGPNRWSFERTKIFGIFRRPCNSHEITRVVCFEKKMIFAKFEVYIYIYMCVCVCVCVCVCMCIYIYVYILIVSTFYLQIFNTLVKYLSGNENCV